MTITITPTLPHGRWDIYGPIHKGLRLASTDFMIRIGRLNFEDGVGVASLIGDLRSHLELCAAHLAHEESMIHPALEGRLASAAARLDRQHAEHRQSFATLEELISALEAATPEQRAQRGRQLYLAFSTFLADDLAHMHEEETVTWPLLCTLFTDEELAALEMRIIQSLTPETNLAFMRLMIPAMNRQERAALLGGMQASAPPEAFSAVIAHAARPTLPAEDFDDLASRLALAA